MHYTEYQGTRHVKKARTDGAILQLHAIFYCFPGQTDKNHILTNIPVAGLQPENGIRTSSKSSVATRSSLLSYNELLLEAGQISII
jgi:hypothetical protein